MAQFAGLHRRQDDQISYSDGDYYSTDSYDAPSSSLQPTTAESITPTSATATASTSRKTITSSPRPTTTGSASTDTALSSSSSDLSTGAKAGIGVAIPLLVMLLGVSLSYYFRKRRANRRNGAGNNIPEISQQPWPEKPSPESKNLPAEADSTALHEPDSSFVFKSPSLATGAQSPGVYELSSNSAVEYPPAAALATQKHRTSLGHHSPKPYSPVSNDVFHEAVTSATSTPASEMTPSGAFDVSMSALTDSGAPSQNPQVKTWEGTGQPSSGVENTDAQLAQLEAEMAHIAEERERLQQMQVLADREAELKRQIAARKAANSERKPDSSL